MSKADLSITQVSNARCCSVKLVKMEVFAGKSMPAYDRAKEAKEFDETTVGVKELVDSGVVKIPRFFIHAPEDLPKASDTSSDQLQVPLIDLEGANGDRRMEIVDEIRRAAETWGFFQMVSHGVPANIMEEMIEGVRRFHEQPKELKMEVHSRDIKRSLTYYCNKGIQDYNNAWNWKDTFSFDMRDAQVGLDPDALPSVCRKITVEYLKCINALKETLSELLSEALGLNHNYFKHIKCAETFRLSGHYYPICPEPDLTFGANKHSDPGFLTILMQNHVGGLQVLHGKQWVDVLPIEGALTVNIGDLLQLMTNDKFKSVEHRVLAGSIGPRISVACFLHPSSIKKSEPYGPLEELLSEDNPPKYGKTLYGDYLACYLSKVASGNSALSHFRLVSENYGES